MDFNNLTNGKCEKCGGSGVFLMGKGMTLTPVTCSCKFEKPLVQVERELTQKWLDEHIPNKWYQREDFKADVLINSLSLEVKATGDLNAYTVKLKAILRAISLNRTPNHSYFISAPKGYGKKHFAYTLMREMYKKGLNVSPLHPLWKMRDVWVSSNRTTEISKMLEGIDVLFFTASKMLVSEDLYFLDWVLYECELRGITVIVLSRFRREKFTHPNLDISINHKVDRNGAFGEMEYIHV